MAIENPVVDGIEGPPCGDCIHAVVCGLRTAYQTFIRARLPVGGDLPIGLSWRIAVDCEHYISNAVAVPFGWSAPDVASLDAATPAWFDVLSPRRELADIAVAVNELGNIIPSNIPDADATTGAGALQEAAPDATPVVAIEPPLTGRQQNEIALAHDTRDDPPAKTVPLGTPTVFCDPGCGAAFAQGTIGAHRRTCEAVLKFKAERGVTVVPDLLGSAAPLPEAAASDFDSRRQAHAKEAADRTWQQNHAADDVITRAAAAKKEVERVGRTPTTPIEPSVPPAVKAKTAKPEDPTSPLTLHQRRVLATVLRHNGDRKAAAAELGLIYQSIDVALEYAGKKGQLPADLIAKLPARFARFAAVPS